MNGKALYGYACGYPMREALLYGAYVGHACGGSGGANTSPGPAPGFSGVGSTAGPPSPTGPPGGTPMPIGPATGPIGIPGPPIPCIWRMPLPTVSPSRTTFTPG